ncbi:MAG TPA: DUF4179 domain-containing protein [Syntrophomonadaceae bacterium]|nr:DUF4179 domain-containing protein [Syntrophomonadaceae bacterium]
MMIKQNNLQKLINARLSNLQLNNGFEYRVLDKVNHPQKTKRPLTIAAAICLGIMLSIPVMAATISSFTNLLSLVGSETAQILQPVNLVSESNGIKMEVVAAMNDDETAVAYVTMQDLTNNRVDQSLSIYDYNITGANSFTSQVVAYDEKTKTATIRLLANGNSRLNGKKVTVRVTSFLSGKHEYNEVDPGIDLNGIERNPATTPLNMNNIPGGGGEMFEKLRERGTIQILKPDEKNISLPDVAFARISNIGIVEGLLHVQIKWTGNGIDDHGEVYLIDASGKIIHPSGVSYGTDVSGKTIYGHGYEENIFDIDPGQLGTMKMKGYFVTNGNYVQGKWQTTFKIEAVKNPQHTDCNIDLGDIKITSVSLSPLGIGILAQGENKSPNHMNVSVTMTDGSIQNILSSDSFHDNGRISIKYLADSPLDVAKVKEVTINGNIIGFQ